MIAKLPPAIFASFLASLATLTQLIMGNNIGWQLSLVAGCQEKYGFTTGFSLLQGEEIPTSENSYITWKNRSDVLTRVAKNNESIEQVARKKVQVFGLNNLINM